MKIKIVAALALVTVLTAAGMTFPSTAASASSSDDYIKIGLKYASSARTAEITSDKGLELCTAGNDTLTVKSDVLSKYGDITLTLSGKKITVTDQKGKKVTELSGDGTECITSSDYFASNDYVTYNGSAYRGGIIPYINKSGQLNIINYVGMDDYIKGVLHKEISQSSNMEALKAQAVTARSYAEANKGTHKSQGFDLCTTSHCQNYTGVKDEYTSTNEAVESTSGQMIYYNGKVVAGYYFANSGGHTENSEDVWSSALGYLRGVPDAYSPEYTWSNTFTRSELTRMFSSEGLGTVTKVSVDGVNDSGYVASLTITGTNKAVIYKKDKIRSAFPGTHLKSRMFTLDASGATITSDENTTTKEGNSVFYAISSAGKSLLGNALTVLSSNGTFDINLNGMKILDGNGQVSTAYLSDVSTSTAGSEVSFNSDSDTITINGRGNGHGVGMSQQGAIQMGKQGFSYVDILKYYYTDIEVK